MSEKYTIEGKSEDMIINKSKFEICNSITFDGSRFNNNDNTSDGDDNIYGDDNTFGDDNTYGDDNILSLIHI